MATAATSCCCVGTGRSKGWTMRMRLSQDRDNEKNDRVNRAKNREGRAQGLRDKRPKPDANQVAQLKSPSGMQIFNQAAYPEPWCMSLMTDSLESAGSENSAKEAISPTTTNAAKTKFSIPNTVTETGRCISVFSVILDGLRRPDVQKSGRHVVIHNQLLDLRTFEQHLCHLQ